MLEDISIAFFADISIACFPAKALAMKSKAAQSKAMKSKAMKSKAMQSKATQSKAMKSKAMQSKANLKRGDIQCSGYISLDTFGDDARRCPRTMFACMAGDAPCGWAGAAVRGDRYGHWWNLCFAGVV